MASRSEDGDQGPASAGPCNPERLVAATIAELPDRFDDFTRNGLDKLRGLSETLLEIQWRAMADERALLDRLEPRLESDGQTLREVATDSELGELREAGRRYLSVERAQAAWAEYERRIGVPWPVPETYMTTSEDPDGSLVLVPPPTDG